MKILRFNDDRIGVLKGDERVVDISDLIECREEKGPQRVMEELIEGFEGYRNKIEKIAADSSGIPLSAVTLLVPMPRPGKCLCAYVNYLEDTAGADPEALPIEFFYKTPDLLGPEGTIELLDIPAVTAYHPEAELAFVVGKSAKNVKQEDAMQYVFGYVPFFDISARGLKRASQFLAKGQDTFGPCGPWITTADEIPDPHGLMVTSWINGERRQHFSTNKMLHKIPKQLQWVTRFVRLGPGDVIATGTAREGIGPINDGDTLEIEIERLGKARYFVKGQGPRKEAQSETRPRILRLDITNV